ncbi:hypothetical protein LTR70_007746 [Exophiala xenobiotica]|nr:hypothetical protein LTR70_007746 [Exophiala xenobiotica]
MGLGRPYTKEQAGRAAEKPFPDPRSAPITQEGMGEAERRRSVPRSRGLGRDNERSDESGNPLRDDAHIVTTFFTNDTTKGERPGAEVSWDVSLQNPPMVIVVTYDGLQDFLAERDRAVNVNRPRSLQELAEEYKTSAEQDHAASVDADITMQVALALTFDPEYGIRESDEKQFLNNATGSPSPANQFEGATWRDSSYEECRTDYHAAGYEAYLTLANTLAMLADGTFGHDQYSFEGVKPFRNTNDSRMQHPDVRKCVGNPFDLVLVAMDVESGNYLSIPKCDKRIKSIARKAKDLKWPTKEIGIAYLDLRTVQATAPGHNSRS